MKRYIITVYYLVDNFCKIYEEWIEHRLLSTNQQRHRIGKLSLAELMTTEVLTKILIFLTKVKIYI